MGVPDLSAAADLTPLSDGEKFKAEFQAGLRCGGCRERIEGTGFEFLKAKRIRDRQGTHLTIQRTFACARASCGYAEVAAKNSMAMKPIQVAWMDAPEALAILGGDDGQAPDASEPPAGQDG
ncbi:MAG TPA: hypothetical protein VF192_00965 [Longimicrobiales bacterium]